MRDTATVDQPNRIVVPVAAGGDEDIRRVPLEELDCRVQAAAELWETLLDECVSCGMLPSPPTASLLTQFFERDYWVAEEARIEGLRRRTLSDRTRTLRPSDLPGVIYG